MRLPTQPTVLIYHCDAYDPQRIAQILTEGLRLLDLKPYGRTLVKPNIVAAGPLFPHAYTRPEFAQGMLLALQARADELAAAGDGPPLTELAIGERCGITVPSRVAFAESGYDEMLKSLPQVRRYLFDEVPQREVRYTHKERLRDYVFTPEPIAQADFFVNIPKFKAHPWTTVTFSMKNYIGIQDDRHRLIDHDHKLDEKVADLQYVVQPQFIAIDGIIAGEGEGWVFGGEDARLGIRDHRAAVAPSMNLKRPDAGSEPFGGCGEQESCGLRAVAIPVFEAELRSGVQSDGGLARDPLQLVVRDRGERA